MTWKHPNTITGAPAEGVVYYRRNYINYEFWRIIKKGEHVLFTAPRRVGKTSVMKDLEQNCENGYKAVYDDIESDKTQQDFYKRLFNLLLVRIKWQNRYLKKVGEFLKSRDIGGISVDGIKIERKDIDYKTELLELLQVLGNEELKIVLMLDEFPDVIMAIERTEGKDAAINVLNTLRKLRHDKSFKNISFVLAGSIGIDHVISSLDRPKLINDLVSINITELTVVEAEELVDQLTQGATMKIGSDEMSYMLAKISHLLPYFIQVFIDESNSLLHKEDRPELTRDDINKVFETIIKQSSYFEDWEQRLRRYLAKEDFEYCIGVLTQCAHNKHYPLQKAYDFSHKVKPVTSYKKLLDSVLVKDGYLIEESNSYRFLSPFLQAWWQKRHPQFEIED